MLAREFQARAIPGPSFGGPSSPPSDCLGLSDLRLQFVDFCGGTTSLDIC